MELLVVWLLTALVILATICIGVLKGILSEHLSYNRGPRDFVLGRLARYGDPFTISLMGRTYTVVSSPEAVKFVLSTASASFPDVYPIQYRRLLSPERFVGKKHVQIRKIILSAVSGEGLQKLLPHINSFAEETVNSWSKQAVVNAVEKSNLFAFELGMHITWATVKPGSKEMEEMRNQITLVGEGLANLPINLPGFNFHKSMKAKQDLVSRLQKEISRRRNAGIHPDDLLNSLMGFGEEEFPDYDICCVMVILMFAGAVTTSALVPWLLKYLDTYPEVRQRVQDEQDCLREKMSEDKSFGWFKPRTSMPYTLQVIYEILRIEFFFAFPRQAIQDIECNGLIFRKGSYVWASATCLHFDPKHYSNPKEFDPSRFAEKHKPSTFLPFGQGPHLCPGSEFALAQIMFVIHHLVTNYSWKKCGFEKRLTQHPIRSLASYPICLVKKDET